MTGGQEDYSLDRRTGGQVLGKRTREYINCSHVLLSVCSHVLMSACSHVLMSVCSHVLLSKKTVFCRVCIYDEFLFVLHQSL